MTRILERHLESVDDAASLWPLLKEASGTGAKGGKFEVLYGAIALGQELGIEITYGMQGPTAETFLDQVQDLVETCLGFGPKAISILKDAAWGVVVGTPWEESRSWFECIVSGLERLEWPGSRFHRELVDLGFFEGVGAFSDDGTNADNAARCEHLFAYLRAVYEERWDLAADHLAGIRTLQAKSR